MADTMLPFNSLVANAVTACSPFKPDELIILDNSDKYNPEGLEKMINARTEEAALAAIFDTMSQLNRTALETPQLCAGTHGPSFRDCLHATAGGISLLTKGRPVRFVELGPEPWKSRAILAQMLAGGIEILQYVGVDINPESESTMKNALVPLIGANRFSYWVQDFYKASIDDFPPLPDNGATLPKDYVTIMVNLGFQEGNDLPSRIGPMLTRLTRPGDLLVSEMQVSDAEQDANIREFYLHPEMRRFSALVGQNFEKNITVDQVEKEIRKGNYQGEDYIYQLVPLQTDVGTVKVATTLVPIHSSGSTKYVLTNSCLKYTVDQFQLARETYGKFVVRSIQRTGDKSVVFQISERV